MGKDFLTICQGLVTSPRMTQIESLEFPFVNALPKREKGRLQKLWDLLDEMQAASQAHGVLVPMVLASDLLGISRQRVHELVEGGRLKVVDVRGRRFLPRDEILAYASQERKAGRPPKVDSMTFREAVKASVRIGREVAARKAAKK